MKKQKNFEDAQKRNEAEKVSKPAKPLTREEVEKQLRDGNLTKKQADVSHGNTDVVLEKELSVFVCDILPEKVVMYLQITGI